ncbi:ABC transporter ATP-binding protein [Actinopolymorpha pittospori]|uniref:ATP-binding cassette subfamily B protein n=1 Tax=Actinopolymorpha pittospori TaxID=648752 RepID=A0A927MTM8_9ACTN|nr:ABC transporter ATP-binding protein [Actinopolymorpha pittospori]MBE1606112.1 ATP-binding cassette subfamily B protein [Actinopolymorpha pittospori]
MPESVRALRLWITTAFRAAPALVVAQCLLAVLQAVTAPAQTLGVKLLVDGITGDDSSAIGWGTAVIILGFTVMFVGMVISGPIQDTTAERVAGQVYRDLLDVTVSVPSIIHHEHPEVADKLELIREHAWRLGMSFEMLLFIIGTAANTVAVLGLLGSVHPVLLLLPVLGLGRVWSSYLSIRRLQDAFEETAPQGRVIDRLIEISKDARNGLEVRVFGLRSVLVDRLSRLHDELYDVQGTAMRKGALLDGSVRLLFGLVYAAAIVWAIARARAGGISAGDVVLLILVAPQVDQMAGGLAGNVYWLGEVLRSFGRYEWLRTYAEKNSWAQSREPAPTRLSAGIRLENVEFSYPGSERPVLKNVNLTLPAGATVALVGENGAGKTTLVKVLARLYDPSAGTVWIDDTDLRTIDPAAWRKRMSAGFQDFVKFQLTAREVVGIGDTERQDDEQAIQAALVRGDAEAVVARLPKGLDTQLGKKFTGGMELSGGQWQRLALARAFMRERTLLLLLDEPTAALDPEAEHVLFERFAEASRVAARETGGVTILVSHRFSTVRMADLIVVMVDGQVTEVGSHEELLDLDGRYAELFEMQARAYR